MNPPQVRFFLCVSTIFLKEPPRPNSGWVIIDTHAFLVKNMTFGGIPTSKHVTVDPEKHILSFFFKNAISDVLGA